MGRRSWLNVAVTHGQGLTLAAALVVASTGAAFAHGGAYRGPVGRVSPDRRGPTDAPPPPATSPAAQRAAGGRSVVPAGFADWRFWWARRQDQVLAAAVAGHAPRLDRDEIRRWVVPELRRLLGAHRAEVEPVQFDVAAAAALALARHGDTASAGRLGDCAARTAEPRVHRVLEETAALALGLSGDGDPATTQRLRDVVANPDLDLAFARPFAALALALRERDAPSEATRAALIAAIPREERKLDVRPAALAALGVLGDAKCVEALSAVALPDEALPRPVPLRVHDRAAAIAALGVVRERRVEAVETLTQVVVGDHPGALRREAVLALGNAAARADAVSARVVLERLIGLLAPDAAPGADAAVEPEHVVQAIGRMAESAGAVGDPARAFLAGLLRADDRPSLRANAALCLGLAARAGGAASPATTAVLRGRFAGSDDPQERAACCLALGLVGDTEAVPALRAVVADAAADEELRGFGALALALLGSGHAEIEELAAAELGVDAAVQAHLALGVLGGDRAREILLGVFGSGSEDRQWVLGAAAWALGVSADMDTVAVLVGWAEGRDAVAMDLVRALAVTALGVACARPDAPTLDALRDAIPCRVLTPSFLELLTII